MDLFLLHLPEAKPGADTNLQPLLQDLVPPHNPNGRLDFASDLIRPDHLPTMYTEGCIAAGCPENLW